MTTPGDKNCWRKIGVWGLESPRCELLELHLHCRNCAVFRNAGREQYNREIELDYLKLRTEELAQPLPKVLQLEPSQLAMEKERTPPIFTQEPPA